MATLAALRSETILHSGGRSGRFVACGTLHCNMLTGQGEARLNVPWPVELYLLEVIDSMTAIAAAIIRSGHECGFMAVFVAFGALQLTGEIHGGFALGLVALAALDGDMFPFQAELTLLM